MNQFVENYFERAYKLAYFLHPEKALALVIARNALAKLEVTSNAQFKRYYYQPTGRSGREPGKTHRSRVNYAEPHLLQRLLYIESDGIEREQETLHAPLKQEDMVIRFTKFLVKQTLRRNSFYVTLGVGRLLHNYTTSETMDLFAMVVQDPERVRDDFYYRSRKKRLMKEIRDRFGDLLSVVRGFRGEQRFRAHSDPKTMNPLVRECLGRFTPWDTDCVVQDGQDPYGPEIPGLSFKGQDPDEEHIIEINRIHTVLHPRCFQRICDSLKMDAPDLRLAAPIFNLATDDPSHSDHRKKPPDLKGEDLAATDRFLDEQKNKRKNAQTGMLSVRVDQREVARLHPGFESEASFHIPCDADLIEVYSEDHILLAAHLVTNPEKDACFETHDENGLEFRFYLKGQTEDEDFLDATVSLLTPAPEMIQAPVYSGAPGYARRSKWQFIWDLLGLQGPHELMPVLTPLALAFCIAAGLYYITLVKRPNKTIQTDFPTEEQSPSPGSQTRDIEVTGPGLQLSAVSAIFVASLGDEPWAEELKNAVIWELGQTYRFTTPAEMEEADAVLKYLPNGQETSGKRSVLLVNENGNILWTANINLESEADVETLAKELVHALLEVDQNPK